MLNKFSLKEKNCRDEITSTRAGFKRPLVPLVLALILGLAAADWGLQVPKFWLLAALTGLLVVLGLLYFFANFKGSRTGPPDNNDSPAELDQANQDNT